MRRLVLILSLLACTSCVDIFRGAIIQMNLRSAAANVEGEHYQLFGIVNGGAVALARFKILNSHEDCGFDPFLSPAVQLVQEYDNSVTSDEICDTSRRLGTVDKVDTATAQLVGGIRMDTAVDLSEAEAVFITVEPDGDADERPATPLMHGDLAAGIAPFRETTIQCRKDFCADLDAEADAELIEELCGDNIPTLPRARRGVRRAVLLQVPFEDECRAIELGRLTVVPAEDDTFL